LAEPTQPQPDKPKPDRHWAELVAGAGILILAVAFVFYGVLQFLGTETSQPGLHSAAAEGAKLAAPSDLLFLLFASMAMVGAAGVAFSRNIIYSALALLATLLGTGALYVFLNADFVAITQLLIYIGGVLVLILFAVMLTNRIGDKKHSNPMTAIFPGLGLLGALLGILGFIALKAPWQMGEKPFDASSTVERIGDLFLGHYLLAFEVISLLLLATLVGAVVIARKEIKE
jgi:NAD(P)H-quinone oxidoreductase subunit 6